VAFCETVIAPTLGSRRGVIYVLPEEAPVLSLRREAELSLRVP
jgi:hypothetical protein